MQTAYCMLCHPARTGLKGPCDALRFVKHTRDAHGLSTRHGAGAPSDWQLRLGAMRKRVGTGWAVLLGTGGKREACSTLPARSSEVIREAQSSAGSVKQVWRHTMPLVRDPRDPFGRGYYEGSRCRKCGAYVPLQNGLLESHDCPFDIPSTYQPSLILPLKEGTCSLCGKTYYTDRHRCRS